ncbi:MAG: hypothetical protein KDA77_21580 [Planctomycetaceae bacterium]|nr:hypothetical protein [Planctomycetaceae bacterium]
MVGRNKGTCPLNVRLPDGIGKWHVDCGTDPADDHSTNEYLISKSERHQAKPLSHYKRLPSLSG